MNRQANERAARPTIPQRIAVTLILILILAATTASAEPAEPRFFLEKITVEGQVRASATILVSQSRLETGREYSENELRQAVYRINRLPFVVESRFSLRKGSERGRYELVITVEETERFFFGLDLTTCPERVSESTAGNFTAGIRQFVGAGGVLFGSVQPTYTSYSASEEKTSAIYSAGYTQYNLFGKPISLTVGASYEPQFERVDYSLGIGFQLPHSQSLRIAWHGDDNNQVDTNCLIGPDHQIIPCRSIARIRKIETEWRFDTTDDPLFPASGTLVGVYAERTETESGVEGRGIGTRWFSWHSTDYLSLTGRRHYPLRDRHSIAARASADYSRSRGSRSPPGSSFLVRGGAEYAFDLLRTRPRGAVRDLRWQSMLELASSQISGGGEDQQLLLLGTSLVLRNRWGVFRLGLFYNRELGGNR